LIFASFKFIRIFAWGGGVASWKGHEVIGIGGFLMVEYHKSSAAYTNHLMPLCSEDFCGSTHPAQNVFNTTKLIMI
jgi:hypothetical protein